MQPTIYEPESRFLYSARETRQKNSQSLKTKRKSFTINRKVFNPLSLQAKNFNVLKETTTDLRIDLKSTQFERKK